MSKLLLVIGSLLAFGLAGCTQTISPASVAGECNVFKDPGFRVRGKAVRDDRWVASTQEKGIQVCKWKRPKPEVGTVS